MTSGIRFRRTAAALRVARLRATPTGAPRATSGTWSPPRLRPRGTPRPRPRPRTRPPRPRRRLPRAPRARRRREEREDRRRFRRVAAEAGAFRRQLAHEARAAFAAFADVPPDVAQSGQRKRAPEPSFVSFGRRRARSCRRFVGKPAGRVPAATARRATRREAVFPARLSAAARSRTRTRPRPGTRQRGAQRRASCEHPFVVVVDRRSRSRAARPRTPTTPRAARATPRDQQSSLRSAHAPRRGALRRRRHLRVRPRERASRDSPTGRSWGTGSAPSESFRAASSERLRFRSPLERSSASGARHRRRRRRLGTAATTVGTPLVTARLPARRAGARGVLAQARLARGAHDAHDAREPGSTSPRVRTAHSRVLGGAADQLPAPGKRPGAARQARAAGHEPPRARRGADTPRARRARERRRPRSRASGVVADHQRGRGRMKRT